VALQQEIAAVPGHNLVSSLQQVADALVPALQADVATIRLLGADAKLHLVAASGLRPAETRRLALDPITIRRLETMIESGPPTALGSLGLNWVEVRWLEVGGKRIGILTIGARSKRRPPEDDLTLLDAASAQLGNALEHIERSSRFLRSRSLEVARVNTDVGAVRASPQRRPPPTRARDPPPLRRRTPNRSSRRTTRSVPAHSPDTRQERSPPPWRQLPSRGTRPSQSCRGRSLCVTDGNLEQCHCRH
jgi:hypothetical protein